MKKNEAEKDIDEVRSLSDRTQKRLKKAFDKVIDNPTEARVKRYQDFETALLSLYARELYKLLSGQINQYVDVGKTQAVQQLLKKGFEKKKLSTKVYNELKQAQRQSIKASVLKMVASIKQNSRNNILDMRKAFILQKKRLASGFMDTFSKYGVAYFNDARGGKWSLPRYTDMLSTQTVMTVQREAFFATSLEYGNDLVKIIHLGISPEECELCAPFTNKVLSICGQTKGYMTISEAENCGLFHINCDHTPQAMELAPEKEENDNMIALSEQNEKNLQKNGVKVSQFKKKSFIEKSS